jgi:hypothetical protein
LHFGNEVFRQWRPARGPLAEIIVFVERIVRARSQVGY